MITLHLTTDQFFYLQAAVSRDMDALEEMAPWDIDDQIEAHADEIAICKAVGRLLKEVEQRQVITH